MRMFTIVRHVYTGVFRNWLKGMLIVKFCTNAVTNKNAIIILHTNLICVKQL